MTAFHKYILLTAWAIVAMAIIVVAVIVTYWALRQTDDLE